MDKNKMIEENEKIKEQMGENARKALEIIKKIKKKTKQKKEMRDNDK